MGTVKRTRRRILSSFLLHSSSATVKRTRRRILSSFLLHSSSATVKRTRRRIQSHGMVVIMVIMAFVVVIIIGVKLVRADKPQAVDARMNIWTTASRHHCRQQYDLNRQCFLVI